MICLKIITVFLVAALSNTTEVAQRCYTTTSYIQSLAWVDHQKQMMARKAEFRRIAQMKQHGLGAPIELPAPQCVVRKIWQREHRRMKWHMRRICK